MFYKYKYSSICNRETKGFDSVMWEQIQVDGPHPDESEADNIENICIMMSSVCFLIYFSFFDRVIGVVVK
jgi:hypothetical protein